MQEEFQDCRAVVGQSGFEFADALVAGGPGRLVDQLMHPRHQHVLVVGPVEDRDFASSWRMRMHPPEKIMGKLQRRRLLKTDHRRALRIKRAEYVVYGAVLAAGVQRLQYHQDRVLLLGMQKSLLVGEFLAEVFGLLPRRFRRFVVALVAWIELVQTQLFTGIDAELFAVVHAFPLRACRPNAATVPASRGTRQELIAALARSPRITRRPPKPLHADRWSLSWNRHAGREPQTALGFAERSRLLTQAASPAACITSRRYRRRPRFC